MSGIALARLSGSLQLRTGVAVPGNLHSSRRDWASLLAPGLPAQVLPERLSRVFGLCSHAHRLCSRLAIAAASSTAPEEKMAQNTDEAQILQRETLREHLRRIVLDWPRLLPKPGMAAQSLQLLAERAQQSCPLLKPACVDPASEQWRAPTLAWLERELLGMSAVSFLALWQCNPATCLKLWSEEGQGFLPQLFLQLQAAGHAPRPAVAALRVHASPSDLRQLAQRMREQAGFCMAPQWQGKCAETGPWTRLRLSAAEQDLPSLWLRLGARLAECLRLALPDSSAAELGATGAQFLDAGALRLGPGQGLAWVEMARGLLIHQLALEPGPESKVRICQVLAPTEWNFHASGAVAQSLADLPSDLTPRVCQAIHLLMNAYDPCVSYDLVDSRPMRQAVSPNLAGDCHA